MLCVVPCLLVGQDLLGKITPASASNNVSTFYMSDLVIAEDVGTFAAITTLSLGTFVNVTEINDAQSQFKVSPNPTTDLISISSYDSIETLRIFDINGKIVYEGNASHIDVTGLRSGTYIVQVNNKNALTFIKQ